MKFPAAMALSHVDLTGYPHTACIHLIPCSDDDDDDDYDEQLMSSHPGKIRTTIERLPNRTTI